MDSKNKYTQAARHVMLRNAALLEYVVYNRYERLRNARGHGMNRESNRIDTTRLDYAMMILAITMTVAKISWQTKTTTGTGTEAETQQSTGQRRRRQRSIPIAYCTALQLNKNLNRRRQI